MNAVRPAGDRTWGMLGVPTSAAAHWPGLEKGPAALRTAGLVTALRSAGLDLVDHGDRPLSRWVADRSDRQPNNLRAAVEVLRDARRAIGDVFAQGQSPLVLGGDCTLAVALVSAALDASGNLGLLYIDGGQDLMLPADHPREPILDAMGVAHLLDLPGSVADVADIGPRRPLLRPGDVVFVGFGDEEEDIHGLVSSARFPGRQLIADPIRTAHQALAALADHDHLVLHLDVDVLDALDLPLADIATYGTGLRLEHLVPLLAILLADPRVVGMTVVEANPDHDSPDGDSARRLVAALSQAFRTR
jgi:arginase